MFLPPILLDPLIGKIKRIVLSDTFREILNFQFSIIGSIYSCQCRRRIADRILQFRKSYLAEWLIGTESHGISHSYLFRIERIRPYVQTDITYRHTYLIVYLT